MTPEGKIKIKIREYLKARGDNYSFTPIGSAFGKAGLPDRKMRVWVDENANMGWEWVE